MGGLTEAWAIWNQGRLDPGPSVSPVLGALNAFAPQGYTRGPLVVMSSHVRDGEIEAQRG